MVRNTFTRNLLELKRFGCVLKNRNISYDKFLARRNNSLPFSHEPLTAFAFAIDNSLGLPLLNRRAHEYVQSSQPNPHPSQTFGEDDLAQPEPVSRRPARTRFLHGMPTLRPIPLATRTVGSSHPLPRPGHGSGSPRKRSLPRPIPAALPSDRRHDRPLA